MMFVWCSSGIQCRKSARESCIALGKAMNLGKDRGGPCSVEAVSRNILLLTKATRSVLFFLMETSERGHHFLGMSLATKEPSAEVTDFICLIGNQRRVEHMKTLTAQCSWHILIWKVCHFRLAFEVENNSERNYRSLFFLLKASL